MMIKSSSKYSDYNKYTGGCADSFMSVLLSTDYLTLVISEDLKRNICTTFLKSLGYNVEINFTTTVKVSCGENPTITKLILAFRILRAFDRLGNGQIKEWYLDIIKWNPIFLIYVMHKNHYNVFTDMCYSGYALRHSNWNAYVADLEKTHATTPNLRLRQYSFFYHKTNMMPNYYNNEANNSTNFNTYEKCITVGAHLVGLVEELEKWKCIFPTATLVKNKIYSAWFVNDIILTVINENGRKLTIKKERFVKQNE